MYLQTKIYIRCFCGSNYLGPSFIQKFYIWHFLPWNVARWGPAHVVALRVVWTKNCFDYFWPDMNVYLEHSADDSDSKNTGHVGQTPKVQVLFLKYHFLAF